MKSMQTNEIAEVLSLLHGAYINPKTELENWKNPIQFMACVMLSAQATDKGVNKITSKLFEKYITVEDFACADYEELATYVSSINFFRTKAKRIIEACNFIIENFDGKLPMDIDELTKIPGIGRKSANVILHEALHAESQGVVVDTHITRVSNRLTITSFDHQKNAEKIEIELKAAIPKSEWQFYSNAVVLHGRYICKAKNPLCSECVLNKICPSAFKL